TRRQMRRLQTTRGGASEIGPWSCPMLARRGLRGGGWGNAWPTEVAEGWLPGPTIIVGQRFGRSQLALRSTKGRADGSSPSTWSRSNWKMTSASPLRVSLAFWIRLIQPPRKIRMVQVEDRFALRRGLIGPIRLFGLIGGWGGRNQVGTAVLDAQPVCLAFSFVGGGHLQYRQGY